MAGTTGLEPATSAVTGQRSNQLNYVPRVTNRITRLWAAAELNRGPSQSKAVLSDYSMVSESL